MDKCDFLTSISRRDFLKVAGAAGLTVAGGRLLSGCVPQDNLVEPANQSRKPFSPQSDSLMKMREIVRYAALAANSHNAQAWKFNIQENAIEIHPDTSRHLPIVDPDHRELWISLGCALENLLIAAHAVGYAAQVTYPDHEDYIHVHLAADQPRISPLFDAIPLRQSTRSEYDGRLIENASFEQLRSLPLEPGILQHFVPNSKQMQTVSEYVHQGNLSQYADKAFIRELISWLRFNKKEAEDTQDGLYTRCSGNPEVPRWVGQIFVAAGSPEQQAEADDEKLHSSSGAVIIASASDDRTAWVHTGRVYERLALTMTTLAIHSSLLNQPLEVPALRTQFQSALGLGDNVPQLVVRFGRANPLPQSLRRPIDQVMM